jgi:HEAT repeat protein
LQEDGDPAVRESAARGLGLIADPAALTALEQAAQSDGDRDVRHSAAFAAEVIRAHQPHP